VKGFAGKAFMLEARREMRASLRRKKRPVVRLTREEVKVAEKKGLERFEEYKL
jgi:hypothetical protein